MYKDVARQMMQFIQKSPSCYHVIYNIEQKLAKEGYTGLQEENTWQLQPGGKYYVTRNDSSLIAFQIPQLAYYNFQIVASHSDSPSFKIKEQPEMCVDGHYIELNAEKYGGMLCAPWFDRPLSIAGRAVVRKADRIVSQLVNFDRDLVMIPNVAIHMNRKLNDGYAYNAQKDMIPLFGQKESESNFRKMLAEQLAVGQEDILSSDLFLYNRMPGTVWGAKEEYISSPKLDDLQCVYASVEAFLKAQNQESICVCAVFDNEEVGSATKQGADSTFLCDTLERINACLGSDAQQYKMAAARSFMLSADNAHAVHPHHLDKADPTNRTYMNHGVVIKYNANQKYTTDSVSAAVFKQICEQAQVPVQSYVNRSDVPGGSTLGNLSNRHFALNTVDIGAAQLAMHSPYETAGTKDTYYLLQAMREFYNTTIAKTKEGYQLRTQRSC